MRRVASITFIACVLLAVVPLPAAAQPSVVGRWSSMPALPFFPINLIMLPTGKVMMYPGDEGISGDDPRAWDPSTGTTTPLARPGYDLFCTGHSLLGDGRVLVSGGHIQNNVGLPYASIYNPFTDVWAQVPDMNAGRWYPTNTTLANGDVLVISGDIDLTVGNNRLAQVFQVASGTWRDLTNALAGMDLYPHMHLAPNGKVFNSGPTTETWYLDTGGAGAWTVMPSRNLGYRDYGSSVMYADGKILVMGGGDPPRNTAEVIDLNQASPAWRTVGSMTYARRQMNATLLPDGKVLATGGTSGPGFSNTSTPVYAAEMWDPVGETWSTMASAQVPRLYHSAAVLLPDGRVLSTGGNGYTQAEVYEPPYLFNGARPTITSAPTAVGYGQGFFVGTPEAASITEVTWLRLGAVTHAFNMEQRINRLGYSQAAGGLNIVAPSNANLTPPGYYMLFLLNGSGVPSVGRIIQIGGSAPAMTLGSLSPSSAAAGGPGFTLTANGSGFVNGAVVQWNGANRSTTFVSDTQLTATIPASDIAAVGTAEVRVLNPPPTGGLSNPLVFTINSSSPPTLTVSATSVPVGGTVTTTLQNGPGGGLDWLALAPVGAPDTTYLQWTYVGAGVTTRTWTPPTPGPGTYEFRLFLNDGYTRAATSPAFTVTSNNPVPALTSLVPNSAGAGGAAFTLTVNGSNFVAASVVRWNGANRTTTFVNATQVTAAIPASDIAAQGSAQVTVFTPAPGGGTSNPLTFTITPAGNPVPALTSLVPNSAGAGGAAFTLTVNGSNFVASSVVQWNGANRTTTFVNATQVTAAIPASDIAAQGSAQVTVFTPTPGGGISNPLTFTITPAGNPVPALTSLVPNSAGAGGAAFTLTVNGSNFVASSVVQWNGANRATTLVNATQLTAAIPASDIAAAGTAQVRVQNPPPGGGLSNVLVFTINSGSPTLTVSATSVPVGGTVTTTLQNGPGGALDWLALAPVGAPNTTYLQWTYVGAGVTTRTWTPPTPGPGTYEFRLFLNDGYTRAATSPAFTVSNPAPAISGLLPSSAAVGGPAFTLTVNGSNFVAASVVRWNGANRTTTFVNATQVTAAIPASDIATQGSAQVTVFTPAPGGGTSNALTFTITPLASACPVGQYFAQYFANRTLSGTPAFTRCEAAINYNWGSGNPGGGLPSNSFSVRWTGRFTFGAATHTFSARVNDGVRVWLDGSLIINEWHDVTTTAPAVYTATRTVAAGEHEVKVEYYERSGVAEIQVSW